MDDEFVAWPFPVVSPESEWDEFARDFIGFSRLQTPTLADSHAPEHRTGLGPVGHVGVWLEEGRGPSAAPLKRRYRDGSRSCRRTC